MKKTRTFPTIVLSTVLLAAVLGGCKKEDSGQGGAGDGAQITNRVEGQGQGGAEGVVGATSSSGAPGLPGGEYNNNITPRTVGEHERGARENVPGAIGGASGFSGGEAVGPGGSTTGGANPGGAPMAPAPQEGTKATGHTGDSTGTGPTATRKGEGDAERTR